MSESTNIVRLRQPDATDDPLTEILRTGARQLLAQAIEIEAEAYLAGMRDLKLPDGRERLVRHGHGSREASTGLLASGLGFLPIPPQGCSTHLSMVGQRSIQSRGRERGEHHVDQPEPACCRRCACPGYPGCSCRHRRYGFV